MQEIFIKTDFGFSIIRQGGDETVGRGANIEVNRNLDSQMPPETTVHHHSRHWSVFLIIKNNAMVHICTFEGEA